MKVTNVAEMDKTKWNAARLILFNLYFPLCDARSAICNVICDGKGFILHAGK